MARGDGANWPPEKKAKLRELWESGASVVQIGAEMGMTKNQIVGKAHRMGLPPRESPIKRADDGSRINPPRASRPTPPALADLLGMAAAPNSAVSALPPPSAPPRYLSHPSVAGAPRPRPDPDSRFACAWPMGEPGTPGFTYCGEHVVIGRSYCPDHHAEATMSARSLVRERVSLDAIETYAAQNNVIVPPRSGVSGLIVAVNRHRRARQLVPYALTANAA